MATYNLSKAHFVCHKLLINQTQLTKSNFVLSNCEKKNRATTVGKVYNKSSYRGTVNFRRFDIWQKVTYCPPTPKRGRNKGNEVTATLHFRKLEAAEGLPRSHPLWRTITGLPGVIFRGTSFQVRRHPLIYLLIASKQQCYLTTVSGGQRWRKRRSSSRNLTLV